jgi:hypothetical protein
MGKISQSFLILREDMLRAIRLGFLEGKIHLKGEDSCLN